MFLPEDICDHPISLREEFLWEEVSYFSIGHQTTDALTHFPIHNSSVEAPHHALNAILRPTYSPLSCRYLCLHVTHQDRMPDFLPKVHPPGDPLLDILCLAGAHRLCQYEMNKDEGLKIVSSHFT